jgi:hypothetical protein
MQRDWMMGAISRQNVTPRPTGGDWRPALELPRLKAVKIIPKTIIAADLGIQNSYEVKALLVTLRSVSFLVPTNVALV